MDIRVSVLGAGSWGTTVASLAAHNTPTLLWSRRPELAEQIDRDHRNGDYLDGFDLHPALRATGAWQWAVRHADVLVVPLPMRRDMAQHAYAMLDGLRKRGFEHLVRSAIVLLCATPGSDPNLETAIVDEFDSLGVQTYVRVPFEPVFATGERITLEALSQSSIIAWTNVAAMVTDALAEAIVERQAGLRQQGVPAPAVAPEPAPPTFAADVPSFVAPQPAPAPESVPAAEPPLAPVVEPAAAPAVRVPETDPARDLPLDYRPTAEAAEAAPEPDASSESAAEVHQPPAPARRPQPPKPSSFDPYA